MTDTPNLESRKPTTAAGRILLREHSSGTPHMARHILAIEAEAPAEAVALLRRLANLSMAGTDEPLRSLILAARRYGDGKLWPADPQQAALANQPAAEDD